MLLRMSIRLVDSGTFRHTHELPPLSTSRIPTLCTQTSSLFLNWISQIKCVLHYNPNLLQEHILMGLSWKRTHHCKVLRIRFGGAGCKVPQERSFKSRAQVPSIFCFLKMLLGHFEPGIILLKHFNWAICHYSSQAQCTRAGGTDERNPVASAQTSFRNVFAPWFSMMLQINNVHHVL